MIDFTLGNLRNNINVDEELLAAVSQSNDKASIIRSLINRTDSNHNGNISNQEYLAALTDLENRNLSIGAREALNKILSRNPNHQAIEAALAFIDQDLDSVVSDTEVSRAILARYRGEASNIVPEMFDMVLQSNAHKASIEAIINTLNPSRNGQVNLSDIFNSVLNFKQGNFIADDTIFRAVLDSIPHGRETINAYELIDANHDNVLTLREYTSALLQFRSNAITSPGDEVLAGFSAIITSANIVKEAIDIIDADRSVSSRIYQ